VLPLCLVLLSSINWGQDARVSFRMCGSNPRRTTFRPSRPISKLPACSKGLSLERELASGLTGTLSYLYVHGEDMIRARDVNLPPPTYYNYPIYDSSGNNFQNAFYNVESFAPWQTTYNLSCPFPTGIGPLTRPISQLAAIDQFESSASSIYHGMTVSMQKRLSGGVYFAWPIPGPMPSKMCKMQCRQVRRQRCKIPIRQRVSEPRA